MRLRNRLASTVALFAILAAALRVYFMQGDAPFVGLGYVVV